MTINRKTPVLVLLVMAVLAACQGKAAPGLLVEQPAPLATQAVLTIGQADEIYGIWTLTSHPHYKLAYWLLRPDGSFTFSQARMEVSPASRANTGLKRVCS